MAHDVFISYSPEDKPIADGICANLESGGLRCWIAPRDIALGEDRPAAIAGAITASRIMVLVFSQCANQSEDVSRELYLAAHSKVIIVPFKIEDVQPEAGKAYFLGRTHWLDAMNPPTLEQIGQLIERIRSILSVEPDTRPALAETPRKMMGRSAWTWLSELSWKFRALSFLILAIVLVSGLLVVPQLIQPAPQAIVPTQTSVPTPAPTPVILSPYAFSEDFNNPQFDGSLPPSIKPAQGRCGGMKLVQSNGSLTLQTLDNLPPDCYINFQHDPPIPFEKIKSIGFSLKASPEIAGSMPSYNVIFDTQSTDGSDVLMMICGFLPDPGCLIKETITETVLYRSNTILAKPGDAYVYSVEILDADKMTYRFTINGGNVGEYSLPPEKAARWKDAYYKLGYGVRDDRPMTPESLLYLDYFMIAAR